ncbi:DUF2802 domain-containing protein [Photobacterium leiognathi]|uniref:DNA repair ATPase n=2 Tax=Photobacterium leiognathi TaxID=553611 RepID=A0A0U1P7N0_PHOLE|nr:DUF2802 domain-containing protein [Photobacterium leiognathi]KJF90366.1 DNA repair protein [Photobacterium leiognathi]MCG3885753.1 DUF2802 domain-containing protein [Photobacterium leiognathi]PHZ59095.1 DUF2802 domain-containing protein [Photobacterium leiognathi]PSV03624.1 DUF2802 domain-containing protein [Photobacterium leiognathi subsp. mandapamensis]PSV81492.1 DUF2802 domain-containing protein [Photobacterium leiognathi]
MNTIVLQWLPTVISVLAVVIFTVLLLRERKARRSLETKFTAIETVLKNARLQNERLTKEFNELRAGTMGMSHKLADMSHQLEVVEDRQTEIMMNDPEGRLYSRASKMVELGADVHELMNECDLPKAEAELLLRLQQTMPKHRRR